MKEKSLYRTYTDKNGKDRKLLFIREVDPENCEWKLEDGYVARIPNNAWDNYEVPFKDVKEKAE